MSETGELRKSLSSYIDKYPSPSKEQNDIWLAQLSTLDHSSKEYIKIRERMILSNGAFAMKYVTRYKAILNDDVSMMDLFQEAMLGIIETIDIFDVKLETSFTTYAFFHIRKRIIDFIKKNKVVRAPRDIARNLKPVSEVRNKLLSELAREPSIKEIAKTLEKDRQIKLSYEMIDNIVVLIELNSASHKDSFINEFKEQVAAEDEGSDLFKLMEARIKTKLKEFPDIIQQTIKFRFGIECDGPHTLEEINYMLDLDNATQKVIKLLPEESKTFVI